MTEEQFLNSPLDEEEQWYEDHFDEFVPVENIDDVRKKMIEAAKNPPVIHHSEPAVKKPVTLRLSPSDITGLKSIASQKGIPYQTFIGSILHSYVSGLLVDVSEARKIAGVAK